MKGNTFHVKVNFNSKVILEQQEGKKRTKTQWGQEMETEYALENVSIWKSAEILKKDLDFSQTIEWVSGKMCTGYRETWEVISDNSPNAFFKLQSGIFFSCIIDKEIKNSDK